MNIYGIIAEYKDIWPVISDSKVDDDWQLDGMQTLNFLKRMPSKSIKLPKEIRKTTPLLDAKINVKSFPHDHAMTFLEENGLDLDYEKCYIVGIDVPTSEGNDSISEGNLALAVEKYNDWIRSYLADPHESSSVVKKFTALFSAKPFLITNVKNDCECCS